MPPPLLSLTDITVTFGGEPLLDRVALDIRSRDRLCLVGRNGSGKSTLLKLCAGLVDPEDGDRRWAPGTRVGVLFQDVETAGARTIGEYVESGLADDQAHETYRAGAVLDPLGLAPNREIHGLSGGELRRAALARALVGQPELLFLDEPTNHLDLAAITWLENFLAGYTGAVMLISHDRALLTRVATRCAWLDRGQLRVLEDGFRSYEDWAAQILHEEQEEARRRDVRIAQETEWLRRGVTARRRRNMGRLRDLFALRAERAAARQAVGQAKLSIAKAEDSGKMVFEAESIKKYFDNRPIVTNFSIRILRGDCVAIIGPNGAGKTTLLKMLIGSEDVDSGVIRRGSGLEIAYFDQTRAQLDPNDTPWGVLCPQGGDQVSVGGRQRHVVSYMKDFLFDEAQARTPIRALSGGERNRLLLAQLFAKPANVLVLDEPTNDLDLETLDLLQEVLSAFEGTVLLVSHDRDFVDRIATSTIVMAGNGEALEYVGGFSDARDQSAFDGMEAESARKPKPKKNAEQTGAERRPKLSRRNLGYKDQRELDGLPDKISVLTNSVEQHAAALSDPELYAGDPDRFARITEDLEKARVALAQAEERWLELEEKREQLMAGD